MAQDSLKYNSIIAVDGGYGLTLCRNRGTLAAIALLTKTTVPGYGTVQSARRRPKKRPCNASLAGRP